MGDTSGSWYDLGLSLEKHGGRLQQGMNWIEREEEEEEGGGGGKTAHCSQGLQRIDVLSFGERWASRFSKMIHQRH